MRRHCLILQTAHLPYSSKYFELFTFCYTYPHPSRHHRLQLPHFDTLHFGCFFKPGSDLGVCIFALVHNMAPCAVCIRAINFPRLFHRSDEACLLEIVCGTPLFEIPIALMDHAWEQLNGLQLTRSVVDGFRRG